MAFAIRSIALQYDVDLMVSHLAKINELFPIDHYTEMNNFFVCKFRFGVCSGFNNFCRLVWMHLVMKEKIVMAPETIQW